MNYGYQAFKLTKKITSLLKKIYSLKNRRLFEERPCETVHVYYRLSNKNRLYNGNWFLLDENSSEYTSVGTNSDTTGNFFFFL